MRLKSANLKWALKHVQKDGDTDLFPVPFEFEIIKKNSTSVISDLEKVDINGHTWRGPRRLLVPKSEFSFRSVCQLDPFDSILFAALVREIGRKIEKERIPNSKNKVFSYRFSPKADGTLYAASTGWEDFWTKSEEHCDTFSHVLITDISDFYNQIYHHIIENQLDKCGIEKQYWHAIKNLLANITEGVSRGVPIGPHPAHLIAELAMIPIDQFLDSLGVTWCRYVDDIHIFCNNRDEGHSVLFKFVEYIDKTQKIQINKLKTKILSSDVFKSKCQESKVDQPISPTELEMLATVRAYTTSPYQRVSIRKLTPQDTKKLSQDRIETVLAEYLSSSDVDYTRLRWFIRRLTQIGAPGGIPFIVRRFDEFLPAAAEVGNYFESAARNYEGEWSDIGDELVEALNSGVVQASEYLQVVILSLFSRIKDLNHINKLTSIYQKVSPMCQRKIMLAAAQANNSAWLSSLKGDYKNSDSWKRRAIIYSLRALPDDEKTFWLKSVKRQVDGLDALIARSI